MNLLSEQQVQALAAKIKLCVLDVDGVLTDGRIILGPDKREYKAFDVKDGQGLVMLREYVEIGVITGRNSEVVADRMAQLGIEHVFQGQKNKLAALEELSSKLGLSPDVICFVGDDLPDLAVMSRIGLPIAVADAVPAVKDAAKWCTEALGGRGAVREVCELILNAQGHSQALIERATRGSVPLDANRRNSSA